jgi:galacturonosyltransferase
MLGIPFLPNVTGVGEAFQKKGAVKFFASRLLQASFAGAATVFFQNRSNMDTFTAAGIVPPEKCLLLPGSGVDLDANKYRAYPPPHEPLRFGMAARFCRSKGVAEYFAAAGMLQKAHPGRVEFHFAGPVDDHKLLKDVDNGSVIIHPAMAAGEMPEYFAGLDVLVHPSYHEGLSNVILEALACGRPVLASDIPGCRECCGNDSGILFPVKSADALCAAAEKFISLSHAERAGMGERGRKFVEKHFSRRKVTAAYLETIKKIPG